MPVSADDLKRITDKRNAAMSIITTRAQDGTMAGCVVGFLTQCSLQPVRWLVCISDVNYTFRIALQAPAMAIHFLAKEELPLAELFGGTTGDTTDKFAKCKWSEGPLQLPILSDCKRWVAGKILNRYDAGDHMAYLVDAEHAHCPEGEWNLLYMDECSHIKPGHPR
jgi:flavin reductase (DIM6/NTAB) family NADH-FMN oxidoreductase RutF